MMTANNFQNRHLNGRIMPITFVNLVRLQNILKRVFKGEKKVCSRGVTVGYARDGTSSSVGTLYSDETDLELQINSLNSV